MPSGLKLPLQITPLGKFALAVDNEKISQNLHEIINTQIGERWYEPNVGTIGYSLLLKNLDSTESQVKTLLSTAIHQQEPRVVLSSISIEENTSEGTVTFRIAYFRKDTQEFVTTETGIAAGI